MADEETGSLSIASPMHCNDHGQGAPNLDRGASKAKKGPSLDETESLLGREFIDVTGKLGRSLFLKWIETE